MKMLVAVDGSDYGRRVVEHVIKHTEMFGRQPSLTLMHVATPMSDRAAHAVGREIVDRFVAQEHDEALAGARAQLTEAGLAFSEVTRVGQPGRLIAEEAERGGYDLVVMGSHGQGAFKGLVLGSVVTKVLAACTRPVLIVR